MWQVVSDKKVEQSNDLLCQLLTDAGGWASARWSSPLAKRRFELTRDRLVELNDLWCKVVLWQPDREGESRENPMKDLIEALQILLKYDNLQFPTRCEHDTLYVLVDPVPVSEEDMKKLEELGFFVGEENDDCFMSFHYGSA